MTTDKFGYYADNTKIALHASGGQAFLIAQCDRGVEVLGGESQELDVLSLGGAVSQLVGAGISVVPLPPVDTLSTEELAAELAEFDCDN